MDIRQALHTPFLAKARMLGAYTALQDTHTEADGTTYWLNRATDSHELELIRLGATVIYPMDDAATTSNMRELVQGEVGDYTSGVMPRNVEATAKALTYVPGPCFTKADGVGATANGPQPPDPGLDTNPETISGYTKVVGYPFTLSIWYRVTNYLTASDSDPVQIFSIRENGETNGETWVAGIGIDFSDFRSPFSYIMEGADRCYTAIETDPSDALYRETNDHQFNQWHHAVACWENEGGVTPARYSLYIDGKRMRTTDVTDLPITYSGLGGISNGSSGVVGDGLTRRVQPIMNGGLAPEEYDGCNEISLAWASVIPGVVSADQVARLFISGRRSLDVRLDTNATTTRMYRNGTERHSRQINIQELEGGEIPGEVRQWWDTDYVESVFDEPVYDRYRHPMVEPGDQSNGWTFVLPMTMPPPRVAGGTNTLRTVDLWDFYRHTMGPEDWGPAAVPDGAWGTPSGVRLELIRETGSSKQNRVRMTWGYTDGNSTFSTNAISSQSELVADDDDDFKTLNQYQLDGAEQGYIAASVGGNQTCAVWLNEKNEGIGSEVVSFTPSGALVQNNIERRLPIPQPFGVGPHFGDINAVNLVMVPDGLPKGEVASLARHACGLAPMRSRMPTVHLTRHCHITSPLRRQN